MDPIDSDSTQEEFLRALADRKDQGAWEAFSHRYGTLIRNFAGWCGLSPPDCDDVVQDVYLGLIRVLPEFHYDRNKGRFRAYLKTAVVHAASALRKKHAGAPLSLDRVAPPAASSTSTDGTGVAESELDRAWEKEWREHHVRRAMERVQSMFNGKDLAAFERSVVQGQSGAVVARELDLSREQVYQAKSRVMKRVRELVRQQIEEEG